MRRQPDQVLTVEGPAVASNCDSPGLVADQFIEVSRRILRQASRTAGCVPTTPCAGNEASLLTQLCL